jgi:O-antigen/teichoic acid export membrane protein
MEIKAGLLARNSLLNFITSLTYIASGVFVMPVVIRYLGLQRFGIFSLSWVVLGYFTMFDLGLGRATTKFVAEAIGKEERERISGFLWPAVIFQSILGLMGAIFLSLINPFLVERILNIPLEYISEAKSIFQLVALSIPLVMLSSSFRGLLEAEQRFDLINAVNMPVGIATFILPLVGVLLGYSLWGIAFQLLLIKLISLLAWLLICVRRFNLFKHRIAIKKETLIRLFSFGGWVTVTALIIPIFVSSERFFIGILSTLSNVTYYAAPYEITSRLWIIPGSLSIILFPAFSLLQGKNAHEYMNVIFRRSTKYFIIFIGLAVVIMTFFAQDILRIWLGGDFAQKSTLVFQILLLSFLLNSLANIPYSLIHGIGRPDIMAKLYILELLIYLPFVFFMVKNWGINGAAIACTIRTVLDMIIFFFVACKLNKINMLSFFRSVLLSPLLNLVVFISFGCFITRFPWRLYGFSALTLGYLFLSWFFVLDKPEKSWLITKLSKLSSDTK